MGESSTPRRPIHDTNTSRRQVNTNTKQQQQQQQQRHFIKAKQMKYAMKITGLIASTLMLLVIVMPTSPASARLLAFPDDDIIPRGFGSIEHEYVDRRKLAAMAQEDVPKVEEEQQSVSTGESKNAPMMTKKTNTGTGTGTEAVNAVDVVPQAIRLISLDEYNVQTKPNLPNRDSMGLLGRIKSFASPRPPPRKPRRQPSRRPAPSRRRGGEGEAKERERVKA